MENELHKKLTTALKPDVLEISDESSKHAGHAGARPGQSTHFHMRIISEAFVNLSRLERYRLVHHILKGELEDQIHALSLTLLSPYEI